MKLLPLFLRHGRISELPIVIPGCRRIVLHDLKYRDKDNDLIKACTVVVNGQRHRFERSEHCPKTYHIKGDSLAKKTIDVEAGKEMKFSIEIACEDFSRCHCRERNFQLNISAEFEE